MGLILKFVYVYSVYACVKHLHGRPHARVNARDFGETKKYLKNCMGIEGNYPLL